MSIRDLLETFDVLEAPVTKQVEVNSSSSIESARAAAYETGYASGWDDAKAADDEARQRVQAEFERNVEAISFTFYEAVDHVRSELKTFIDCLLIEFLPEIVPDSLREHIRSELLSIAEEKFDEPIEIVVSPDCANLVKDLANGDFNPGISIVEDTSLAANQIFVRVAEQEKEVNLRPLISELRFQLGAISKTNSKAKVNG